MTITTSDLAIAIKGLPSESSAQAAELVHIIIATIRDGLARGHRVELRGLWTVMPTERPARIGRNPRNGEEFPIPARRSATFRTGKALRDALNPPAPGARP